ncbi:hypothetical protein MTTB_p310 (plasmid) [Methanothermobacter tenebrarum]|uniref:Uncharacterized protein n=1 Tax=Methanothermobacter tenebrarum TaxID=680118 RepID=A0ABN6PHF7_9EURY|nr:hypothetical protein MTTB_p310 [Methanothermobacter tenebrarum]
MDEIFPVYKSKSVCIFRLVNIDIGRSVNPLRINFDRVHFHLQTKSTHSHIPFMKNLLCMVFSLAVQKLHANVLCNIDIYRCYIRCLWA